VTSLLRSLAPILSLIVYCILATAAPAAGPVFPPGSRIGLAPFPDMEPSRRFTGFEDGKGLAFTFVEMPPDAFREFAAGFTPERMKEQGVTLGKREELKVGDRNAVLVTGEQKAGDVALRRWFLVVEDPSMTAFVVAQALPAAQSRPDEEVRAALMTVGIRPPLAIEDQVAALPFRLTERAGFRPVRTIAGNALFLTDGPQDVVKNVEQPIAILGQSTAPAPPHGPQRDAFARTALNANAVFKDARVERAQSFRQKGAEWHEIVASATEIASGAPVVVTQTIRFSPTGYVRMLGVVKAEARDETMSRFRALFDGIEVEER
jgi:hypothetical protein